MTRKLEDLLAELRSKDEELALAASYGKALLLEKKQLWTELQAAREDMKKLEDTMYTQKREAQRALAETKSRADELITDLDTKLQMARANLETEQNSHKNMKGEYQKSLGILQTDNLTLTERINGLLGEKSENVERVRKVSDALKDSQEAGYSVSLQQQDLEKKIESLESANRNYAEELSILAHTCNQLTEELQSDREQLEAMEARYDQLNDEFLGQQNELKDSQELVKQLEAERQRITAGSPTSTMSLRDELSKSMDSLDMLPDPVAEGPKEDSPCSSPEGNVERMMLQTEPETDVCYSIKSTLRRASEQSIQSGQGTLRYMEHQELMRWASGSNGRDSPCDRCEDIQEQLTKCQQELDTVNQQLLLAVKQKIKLQEQNEAWQNDMAEIVHENLHQRLERADNPSISKDKLSKSRKKRLLTSNREDSGKIFKQEFIEKSWLF